MNNKEAVYEENIVESNILTKPESVLQLISNIQENNFNKEIEFYEDEGFPPKNSLRSDQYCFYKVKQLSYDEEYPRREAMENVISTIDNSAFNFVYVLTGTKRGVELSLGVVKNINSDISTDHLNAVRYGEIVKNAFLGNFNGSVLEKMSGEELENIIKSSSKKYKNAGVIVGVPSLNTEENNDYDFQGIDRLINSMIGLEWRLVIVCEPVGKKGISGLREQVYALYNTLSIFAKSNIQQGNNINQSNTSGKSNSKTNSINKSASKSNSSGESHGRENSTNSSETISTSDGSSNSKTDSSSSSKTKGKGISQAVTVELANKRAQELMSYIDDELLPRLKMGYSKGLYKTSVFYMADEPTDANRLKASIISIFQGCDSSYSPLIAQKVLLDNEKNYNIFHNYQNRSVSREEELDDALVLLNRPHTDTKLGLSTYLTTREVSLVAGLPQKEVPGIVLKEAVNFGINESNIDPEKDINLGYMVQKGRVFDSLPFYLGRDNLFRHTFVAGVTGSGKTTTCQRLLAEATCRNENINFLVIEPAKTEYRSLLNFRDKLGGENVLVFTLGNESIAPFRINPFELIEGELITSHVDMLKATFTSAFPMEASMPQILEEAIYKCYEDYGWDIDTNTNSIYGGKAFAKDVNSFPVLSDLLEAMKIVVEEKSFGHELRSNYIGSLVSRLSNLTVGSKGMMLNCPKSVDFDVLLKNNIILELEDLKSAEDKALLMGFILTRLSATIKKAYRSSKGDFRHLTLIEEAHRLLAKLDIGDQGSKKVAVECFTDMLAEIRKYGEGLVIVDQIPNKLATEVLKNTNTKIIHKILAKDDKEVVGDTMLMNDKQKEYLSSLGKGSAIIFTDNTDNPVNVQVQQTFDTSSLAISDGIVKDNFDENIKNLFAYAYEESEVNILFKKFNHIFDLIGSKKNDDSFEEEFLLTLETFTEDLEKLVKNTYLSKEKIIELLIRKRDRKTGFGYNNIGKMDIRNPKIIKYVNTILSKEVNLEEARGLQASQEFKIKF